MAKKSADDLFVDFVPKTVCSRLQVQLIARLGFKCDNDDKLKFIEGWDAFTQLLSGYETIKRLTIFLHGGPGQLSMREPDGRIVGIFLGELKSKFAEKKRKPPAVTESVGLEACNVGDRVAQLPEVLTLFNAPSVIAYTFFHGLSDLTIVPRDGSKEAVSAVLRPYEPFLVRHVRGGMALAAIVDDVFNRVKESQRIRDKGRSTAKVEPCSAQDPNVREVVEFRSREEVSDASVLRPEPPGALRRTRIGVDIIGIGAEKLVTLRADDKKAMQDLQKTSDQPSISGPPCLKIVMRRA